MFYVIPDEIAGTPAGESHTKNAPVFNKRSEAFERARAYSHQYHYGLTVVDCSGSPVSSGEEIARELTRKMRNRLGWGFVEYNEPQDEYVIWPIGRPYGSPGDAQEAIQNLPED